MTVPFVVNDGGRAAAGFKGTADDCVVRAVAIAAGLDYRTVYDALYETATAWKAASRSRAARHSSASPRNGVHRAVYEPYLASLGWLWTPTMSIGSGTTVHLRPGELPTGRLIARCSKHLVAVIDGVIHDLADPSRGGTRAVYGYFAKALA